MRTAELRRRLAHPEHAARATAHPMPTCSRVRSRAPLKLDGTLCACARDRHAASADAAWGLFAGLAERDELDRYQVEAMRPAAAREAERCARGGRGGAPAAPAAPSAGGRPPSARPPESQQEAAARLERAAARHGLFRSAERRVYDELAAREAAAAQSRELRSQRRAAAAGTNAAEDPGWWPWEAR